VSPPDRLPPRQDGSYPIPVSPTHRLPPGQDGSYPIPVSPTDRLPPRQDRSVRRIGSDLRERVYALRVPLPAARLAILPGGPQSRILKRALSSTLAHEPGWQSTATRG